VIEIVVPRENANDDEVLVSFVGDEGDVRIDDVIFQIETSKVSVDVLAEVEGYFHPDCKAGDVKNVGDVVGRIFSSRSECLEATVSNAFKDQKSLDTRRPEDCHLVLSSSANALLESDPEGWEKLASKNLTWVVSSDLRSGNNKPASPKKIGLNASDSGVELDPLEQKISPRKQQEIFQLRLGNSHGLVSTIGINVAGSRSDENPFFNGRIVDVLILEVAKLLGGEFKDLNSGYCPDRQVIRISDQVVAGLAIDDRAERDKLVVASIPVRPSSELEHVQHSIVERLVEFADSRLSSAAIKDSTFTITDLSSTEVDSVLPLLNGNQALMLGVTATDKGFSLQCSFDHRVTEGMRIAVFLEKLREGLSPHLINDPCIRCGICEKTIEEELQVGRRGMLEIHGVDSSFYCCRECFDEW
jgi:pyruvate/2-oxoglutarate dehydrogenase complex dihydrolipoamide acyltransferase (E2) component